MKEKISYENSNYGKYLVFFTFFHKYFLNVNISLTPVWISVKFLPVVNNSQMEGTVSQSCDIAPSFYLMVKNGKIFVIVFLTFTVLFI